jgi:hypothetical protein
LERFLLKLSGAGWIAPEPPFGDRRELDDYSFIYRTMIRPLSFVFLVRADSVMTGRAEKIIRIGIISTDSTFSSGFHALFFVAFIIFLAFGVPLAFRFYGY